MVTRTRRAAIDGGFEDAGNSWTDSGSFESFLPSGYVEFSLPFVLHLGGNGTQVTTVTLWSKGVLSLGPATQAQQDFMAGDDSPIPGPGAGFPGEFFLFDYNDGVEAANYSFGIGLADYTEPYVLAEAVNAAFFTFESGFQIILDENGFAIIEEGGSTTAINGYFVGALAAQAVGSEIEFENFPDFFAYAGTASPDTLVGSDFNDRFLSSGGADAMSGGAGNDLYHVDNAADTVIEGAADGALDRIFTSVSYTLGTGVYVERLVTNDLAATAAINLTGNELANILYGNAGANVLDGRGGADLLGGFAGDDSYYVDHAADAVSEAVGNGTDRIFASVNYTQGAGVHVERLTTTNNAATTAINLTGNELVNVIYGNAGANLLDGKAGNDILSGLAGNDTLIGGLGNDTMAGGLGNDLYYVDSALDIVAEGTGEGTADRIFAGVSYALFTGVQVELLTTSNNAGTAAINLTGNELANIIYGNAGANILDGRGGADTLVGLGGNDSFYVDNALDVVSEAAGGGTADRIYASVSYTQGAGVQVEQLTTSNNAGTTAINLTGNELANVIYGNAGTNVLDGKGGADILVGLAGQDSFAFTTALGAGNIDAISGFVVADDAIRLENAVFTGLAAGALATGAFNTGAAATQADDRVIYNSATGALLFDADGAGGAAAVQFATLAGGLALTSADFLVV